MSGSVTGIDYSVLFPTPASGTGAADLFATIYGTAPGAGGDPLVALTLAQQNQTKDIAQEAKDPTVARDIAAFQKGVAQATTIQQALSNPNVLKVLLTANGLGTQVAYPALAQKVLLSNPADPNSLVNQLGDATWKSAVTSFNFATNGLAALQSPAVQSTLASGYAEVLWRQSLDKTTPGLSYALDFKARASSFTTPLSILGDPTGWEVVTNALAIPQQIAFQDTTAQEQAISSRLDVSRLQDPNFVNNLTDQYLLAKQQAAASTSSGPTLDALAIQAQGLVV